MNLRPGVNSAVHCWSPALSPRPLWSRQHQGLASAQHLPFLPGPSWAFSRALDMDLSALFSQTVKVTAAPELCGLRPLPCSKHPHPTPCLQVLPSYWGLWRIPSQGSSGPLLLSLSTPQTRKLPAGFLAELSRSRPGRQGANPKQGQNLKAEPAWEAPPTAVREQVLGPVLLLPSWGPSGELLHHSEPQFRHPWPAYLMRLLCVKQDNHCQRA